MPTVSVDPESLRTAARRLDEAAETVAVAVATQLRHLEFDGATAGRAYAASGWAVRTALDALAADMNRWASAAAELAAALRAGAALHGAAETHAASVLPVRSPP